MGTSRLPLDFVVLAAVVYIAGKVIYRLYFHPLARFPGPILAKLSDLHAVYYSIRGESHLKIWRAHKKYGPIVRVGPNKLVFDSYQALHDIYDAKEVQKSIGYTALVTTPGAENTFNMIDKSGHRRKRKILGPAFSDQAVRAFEPAVMKQLDIFLKRIHRANTTENSDGWTDPLNMSKLCKWFMMDITGEFGFGASFDLQTKETNRGLVQAVISASKAGGIVGQYPRLKSLRPPKFLTIGPKKQPSTFGRITRQSIDNRLKQTTRAWPDLYSFITNKGSPDPEQSFDVPELLGESRLLILAGSDTTAAVMAATLFYLTRAPTVLATLTAQIRNIFASRTDIRSGPCLTSLTYLRACLDETMRMSPPVGGALGREVLSPGHIIDGTYIPGGCDVGVALYCVHHDETIFPDSFTYKPERWLETHTSSEQIALQRRAFHPFSLGSRKCIAQNMAYTDLSLALAKLLWYFDVRRPEGALDEVGGGKDGDREGRNIVGEFQLYEHFTSIHDGPYLRFKCREGMERELDALQG